MVRFLKIVTKVPFLWYEDISVEWGKLITSTEMFSRYTGKEQNNQTAKDPHNYSCTFGLTFVM